MDEPKNDLNAVTETDKIANDAAPIVAVEPEKTEEAEVVKPSSENTEVPSQPLAPAQKSSSGILPLILGGAVVAGLGFAAGTYAPIIRTAPASDVTNELKAEVDKLSKQLSTMEANSKPVDLSQIEARLGSLESQPSGSATTPDVSGLEQAISALDQRLAAVESAPSAGTGSLPADAQEVISVLRSELADMKSANSAATEEIKATVAETEAKLADAQAEAERLKAEAEKTAAAAIRRSAVSRIAAALESGGPYASALTELDGLDVPAVLTKNADSGIPSALDLAEAFPEAARNALDASLAAQIGGSWQDRATAFLKSTTGARSLTPREGDDPDAILSRAEDDVRRDDLAKALEEIATLPEQGQSAFADWILRAKMRLEAKAAVAQLTAELNG